MPCSFLKDSLAHFSLASFSSLFLSFKYSSVISPNLIFEKSAFSIIFVTSLFPEPVRPTTAINLAFSIYNPPILVKNVKLISIIVFYHNSNGNTP